MDLECTPAYGPQTLIPNSGSADSILAACQSTFAGQPDNYVIAIVDVATSQDFYIWDLGWIPDGYGVAFGWGAYVPGPPSGCSTVTVFPANDVCYALASYTEPLFSVLPLVLMVAAIGAAVLAGAAFVWKLGRG